MTPNQHADSIKKLGNLLDLEYGAALPEQERTGFGYPVFGSNGIVGNHSKALVSGPGIVVGRKGSVGEVSWSSSAFWPIDTSYYVTPKNDVHLRWLYWVLKKSNLKKLDSATGVPGLNRNDAYELDVLVPNQEEQARIAKVLDTVDEAIRKTEALIQKLRQIREGLLHDLLTRGLDENGELRDPVTHPEKFSESQLGSTPCDWQIDKLVSRISFPEGQIDPKRPPYRNWILIAPDHIESGTGRLLLSQTAAQQGAISGKYAFQPGDVIYSKIRPYLRKAILADHEGVCSADMYPLRPKPGVEPKFLLITVLGEKFSKFAAAVSMRSGFPKINREELAEFQMPWPSGDEQKRMSEVITALETKQDSEEHHLTKLKRIKNGLMLDLLTGRVRVPPEVMP